MKTLIDDSWMDRTMDKNGETSFFGYKLSSDEILFMCGFVTAGVMSKTGSKPESNKRESSWWNSGSKIPSVARYRLRRMGLISYRKNNYRCLNKFVALECHDQFATMRPPL